MTTRTSSRSDANYTLRIDDFVNAGLLLDEWLDWMSSLCGKCSGTEEPYFVRSRLPRLALVPHLEPPPDEENRNRLVAYGLSFFSGWRESVQAAVSTWSHLLVASFGPAGAVRSSLIQMVDLSTGLRGIWMNFPESVVDPSAHEAVMGWFASFTNHVQNLGLPDLSESTMEKFLDNRCWPADFSLESHFKDWSWNRDDAARLAAIMEGERRILYPLWQQQGATTESLPDYTELWRRDRRLRLVVVEVIAKLDKPMDRMILKRLLRAQPCKRQNLASMCGVKKNLPGNFGQSVANLIELELVIPGKGRTSVGYRLTKFGNEVAEVLDGMEPLVIHPHSKHGGADSPR